MALGAELVGLTGSFILSDMGLLLLGPSSCLSAACHCVCLPDRLSRQ